MMTLARDTSWLLVLGLCAGIVAAGNAKAEDDLLRFVPADVGAYVRVPGLETTVEDVWQGPLAERVRSLSVYEKWLSSNDFERLRAAYGGLTAAIGRPVDEFVVDLAGTESVLTVTPVEGDGEPTPLLLTRVAEEKSLQDAILTWNRLESAQVTTKLEHAKRAYFRRETKKETLYYAFVDTAFALSPDESRIHGFLDLVAEGGKGGIAANAAHRRATADLPADTRAVVYVSPRPWDSKLPNRDESPAARLVVETWRRAESVVAVLRGGEEDIVAELTIRYEHGSKAVSPRFLVPGDDSPSTFLAHVPGNVLLVSWARIDLGSIGSEFYDSISSDDRRRIEPWRRFVARRVLGGLDLVEDVLPALGPECGAYVVPRSTLEKEVVPFDGLLAVQWNPNARAAAEVDVRRELDDVLLTGLELWVAAHNSSTGGNTARLGFEERSGIRTRWIEGIGSHRPTYAMTPGFLLFASHPRLVPEFVEPDPASRLVDRPWFDRLRRRVFPRHDHLLLLDLHGFRRFVERNEEHLTAEVARMKGTTPDRAAAGAKRLLEFLGLAETVFSAGHVGEDEVRIVLGAVAESRDEPER